MAIPGGSIRRAQPKPFQRPGIDLDGAGRREWRDIPVEQVQPGDTVPDVGLVEHVSHVPLLPNGPMRVVLRNINGKMLISMSGTVTKAFVRLDG